MPRHGGLAGWDRAAVGPELAGILLASGAGKGVDGLALAIPIAALITVPLGLGMGQLGNLDMRSVAVGLVIAIGGLIVPFALELEGSA